MITMCENCGGLKAEYHGETFAGRACSCHIRNVTTIPINLLMPTTIESKLLPCPVCHIAPLDKGSFVNCMTEKCMLVGRQFFKEHWNTRAQPSPELTQAHKAYKELCDVLEQVNLPSQDLVELRNKLQPSPAWAKDVAEEIIEKLEIVKDWDKNRVKQIILKHANKMKE